MGSVLAVGSMKLSQLVIPLGVFLFLASVPPPPVAPADALPLSTGQNQSLRIAVGPPEASLALWTLEPAKGTPIKGTVLFLHGFMATHLQLRNAAEALQDAGYRAVLLDSRGFGQSTGSHYTFGVQDAQDLTQVVTALQKKHLCGKTVGVYGTSMGAATAILFAGIDPRVTCVVAVAPFAEIREEVTPFSRQVLGGLGDLLSDSSLNALANAVGNLTHMDLDDAKPLEAITKTRAQILLIHGDADAIIPEAASKKLHAAAQDHSRLVPMPNRGHLDLCFDWRGELTGMTQAWFDAHLGPH
jgi:pimeloyl-ACP methyl ester carboxylesterase